MELKVSIQTKGKIFEGKAPEIIRESLIAFMYEATQYLERRVKSRTPRRTGLGAQSIYGEVIQKGATMIKGVVGHTSKYLELVERGTGIYGPYGLSFVIRPKDKKALFWPGAAHPVGQVVQKGFPGRFMFENTIDLDWPAVERMADERGFEIAKRLDE
jgi:hypothetical protein